MKRAVLTILCCLIVICTAQNTAPVFDSSNYAFDTPENSPIGTSVGRVTATDPEGDNLTYSITSNTADSGYFYINQSTGELRIRMIIDRESLMSGTILPIVVGVSDRSETRAVNVAITVVDVNDNAPVFSQEAYNGDITSSALTGSSILSVTATDGDGTPASGSIRYRGGSNSANFPFRISETTGTIFTQGSFEGLDGLTFTLIVIAVDNNGSAPFNEARTVVSITILNENQLITIIFNISVDIFSAKEQEVVNTLQELTGVEIVVEQDYRDYSSGTITYFTFYAIDRGDIIEFDDFVTARLVDELFLRLEQCHILRITGAGRPSTTVNVDQPSKGSSVYNARTMLFTLLYLNFLINIY